MFHRSNVNQQQQGSTSAGHQLLVLFGLLLSPMRSPAFAISTNAVSALSFRRVDQLHQYHGCMIFSLIVPYVWILASHQGQGKC